MKHILLISFLFGCYTTAFCQSAALTGSVLDAESKTPLELATVSVFNADSSLFAYKLSDKNGNFVFDKLPLKKKLLVSITYTGYSAYHTSIQRLQDQTDTLNVLLAVNNKDTNSVVVTATVPIRMNADTLEINPAAFKMKEGAVVEELLNQVSGITIWSDGSITVNGKKVENLLVDGKPFLGSTDTRIATQNLPKTAIDKVQLYQEYDRSNIGRPAQPQDSLLTMNIKLKESSKKGYFGKAGAGYGTMKRFETDLSFQLYNKKSSGGIGGGINNINKSIGNLQEMFQNATYRSSNPNLYTVGRFGGSGINKNHSIGGVFTHSFMEMANSRQNNRIAVNYNKSGTDTYITDLNLQNRTTINNQQFIRDEGVQNSITDRHNVGINYVKTNSYNDNLNVNGAINTSSEKGNSSRFTEVRDSANRLQSTNRSVTARQQQAENETLNFNFAKSNNEDPAKNFTASVNASSSNSNSQREVKSEFQSLIDPTKNTFFNRHYATNNNSINVTGNLDYTGFKRLLFGRYNLFQINVNFSQSFNYLRYSDNNQVGDYDSTAKKYITNANISNVNKREMIAYTPSLSLSKDFFKYTDIYYRSGSIQVRLLDDIKTDKNLSSFAKRNLDRSFRFFRYEANINYQYYKHRKYRYYGSAGYRKNYDYPLIDQLYTIVDDINVYDTRIGNPLLKNRINHNINTNIGFNTQKPDAVYSVNGNINGGYTRSSNPVVDSTINDPSGKRVSYYTNADKSSNVSLNYNLNISRKVKKNNFQLMYAGRVGTSIQPNYVDRVYNISETGSLSNELNLQFSLGSTLVANLGKTIQGYTTKQTGAGLTSFKNSNNITKVGIVLNYPANFTVSSTVDHVSNSNLATPTILWNAFATYRFMKQQGELKLSAMDILKQYKNITNNVSSYGTTTRIVNGLEQFFLLTFSYYPRKFGAP